MWCVSSSPVGRDINIGPVVARGRDGQVREEGRPYPGMPPRMRRRHLLENGIEYQLRGGIHADQAQGKLPIKLRTTLSTNQYV